MSGLSVAPMMHYSGGGDALSTPLLVDARHTSERDESFAPNRANDPRSPQLTQPTNSPAYGAESQIQAQVIASELAKSYGRRQWTGTPRDAARAYGQARRRPQTVASQPRLQAIV
jgi:hypothetical protein